MTKTKVDIISGFLGAGKTSLIKKLLQETLYNEKIVLIENEFGEVGIDSLILKDAKIDIKEINSGCICCSLIGNFKMAIEEIVKEHHPDRIIIEPSGVGMLSDVIKAVKSSDLDGQLYINMVLAVVNVLNFELCISNFGEFYEDQIKNAHTIILSRTQKADQTQIISVVNKLHILNPRAVVVTTPWADMSALQIISAAEKDESKSLEHELKSSLKELVMINHQHPENCQCGCHEDHHNSADEIFDVYCGETPQLFDENELRERITNLSHEKFGFILRGKGIMQINNKSWVQFDYVPGEVKFHNANADYSGRFCIIGRNLNKKALSEIFSLN